LICLVLFLNLVLNRCVSVGKGGAAVSCRGGREWDGGCRSREGVGRLFSSTIQAIFQNDPVEVFQRKIRLRVEDVQGKSVLTNFWGMDFTMNKLRSLVSKWQSLIEAHVDVSTTDSYTLRCSALALQRSIRRKMREIMVSQAQSCDLKVLVHKFISESIGREIEKATSSIYPRSSQVRPRQIDGGKRVHGDYSEDVGVKMERPADELIVEET
ncbi:Ribosomal protein S3Ae, partial [Cynara cardunculus var. scolymus]